MSRPPYLRTYLVKLEAVSSACKMTRLARITGSAVEGLKEGAPLNQEIVVYSDRRDQIHLSVIQQVSSNISDIYH